MFVEFAIDRRQRRAAVESNAETSRIIELRHEADIGERNRIAAQIAAGRGGGDLLERAQAGFDPVPRPDVGGLWLDAERAFEIVQHP